MGSLVGFSRCEREVNREDPVVCCMNFCGAGVLAVRRLELKVDQSQRIDEAVTQYCTVGCRVLSDVSVRVIDSSGGY